MIRKYSDDDLNAIVDYFESRTGTRAFEVDGSIVIVYEDHRRILDVMFYLFVTGLINRDNPPDIVSFDYHDDAFDSDTLQSIENKFGKPLGEIRLDEFHSHVEYELSILDNDWVKLAMELDFIRHYVNIGGQEIKNILKSRHHVTTNGKVHELYSIDHLDYELSENGVLIRENDDREDLREIFQMDKRNVIRPLLLDFDLDCFANRVSRNQELFCPWDEKMFVQLCVGLHDDCLTRFMQNLIDRSIVVTICTEPRYCGGYKNAAMILGYLNKYYFKNKLDV